MIKSKDSNPAPSIPKRTITASNVSIKGNSFVDEDGDIIERIKKKFPEGVEEFTVKITLELPENEGNEQV